MSKYEIVKLKTVSPVHTGTIDRKSKEAKTSGIIGSIRWWYEALVRGFGAYACDPTEVDACHFDYASYEKTDNIEQGLKDVCPACRLFGCTGWRKKFKLLVTDGNGNLGVTLNKPGIEFQLQFLEVKPFTEEEKWLLSKVFYLISKYGSICGRTTLKPPRFPDYGIVEVVENITSSRNYSEMIDWFSSIMANSEVLSRKLNTTPPQYPNLRFFFFNRDHWLDRVQMNTVVASDTTGFMKGERRVSKKLFSFSKGKGRRFWGYTTGEEMLKVVLNKLKEINIENTRRGEEVMLSEL